jgi:hypothetical protein
MFGNGSLPGWLITGGLGLLLYEIVDFEPGGTNQP